MGFIHRKVVPCCPPLFWACCMVRVSESTKASENYGVSWAQPLTRNEILLFMSVVVVMRTLKHGVNLLLFINDDELSFLTTYRSFIIFASRSINQRVNKRTNKLTTTLPRVEVLFSHNKLISPWSWDKQWKEKNTSYCEIWWSCSSYKSCRLYEHTEKSTLYLSSHSSKGHPIIQSPSQSPPPPPPTPHEQNQKLDSNNNNNTSACIQLLLDKGREETGVLHLYLSQKEQCRSVCIHSTSTTIHRNQEHLAVGTIASSSRVD